MVADQKAKHRFWINNGRVNEVWQTGYHDMYNEFVSDRWPMAFVEINPDDARALGVASGDVVEVYQRLRLDLRDGLSGAMHQERARRSCSSAISTALPAT